MVSNYKGIAYREGAAVAFLDMAAAPVAKPMQVAKAPSLATLTAWPWAPWGKNNLLPQEMVADIESTGILSAIIDGKARFALCEGITPAIMERDKNGVKVVKEYIKDPEIQKFLDSNNSFLQGFGWMRDFIGFGNAMAQFMLNGARNKIVSFKRADISEMRLQKEDPNQAGKITTAYLCSQWNLVRGTKFNDYVVELPLLDPNNPLADLEQKAQEGIAEHAMVLNYPGWGKHYYSVPLWYAAYKWVKIAQGVPEMKAALFQNSMRIKYVVTIYEDYWPNAFPGQWEDFSAEEKETNRNLVFDEINEYLVGAKNAHKSLFVDGIFDQVTGKGNSTIEIKAIEDNTVQGDLLPDSAAANSEIAFSMLFNPAIIGASMPSGPYTNSQGGSNVRESVLVQVIIHEFERQLIKSFLDVPKYFNGWADKYPGLEFIIPATILTTTDTGGSTKPTLQTSNNNNNANKDNSGNTNGITAPGK